LKSFMSHVKTHVDSEIPVIAKDDDDRLGECP
jgi:hypothetical protein